MLANLITVEHHANGPRLRVLGCRVHHGAVGSLLALVGAGACIHDRRDWKDWFRFVEPS